MKGEYTIDLKGVASSRAFHARLAKTLPLPSTYGRNADALYDMLTEFGQNLTVRFLHGEKVPRVIRRVCADAMGETPGLSIRFDDAN